MKSYRKFSKDSLYTAFLLISFPLRTTVKNLSLALPRMYFWVAVLPCALHITHWLSLVYTVLWNMYFLDLEVFFGSRSDPCHKILMNKIFILVWKCGSYLLFDLGLRHIACWYVDVLYSVKSSHLRPCTPDQSTFTLSLNQWGHYEGRYTITVTIYTRQWSQSILLTYLWVCP